MSNIRQISSSHFYGLAAGGIVYEVMRDAPSLPHIREMDHSEDRYRTMIDAIPAMAWSSLPDGSVEFLNRRWLDYTGLSLDEALGWGWNAAVHPDDLDPLWWNAAVHPDDLDPLTDRWRALLASGRAGEIEARLRRYDGEYRWFLFRAEPVRDNHGDIFKWHGANTDIEDRKRAEALLAAEKRTLEMIAGGARLADILENLCDTIDAQAGNIISAVMLMDTDVAAPRLPTGLD
jgi:PAS domain-containing protein